MLQADMRDVHLGHANDLVLCQSAIKQRMVPSTQTFFAGRALVRRVAPKDVRVAALRWRAPDMSRIEATTTDIFHVSSHQFVINNSSDFARSEVRHRVNIGNVDAALRRRCAFVTILLHEH